MEIRDDLETVFFFFLIGFGILRARVGSSAPGARSKFEIIQEGMVYWQPVAEGMFSEMENLFINSRILVVSGGSNERIENMSILLDVKFPFTVRGIVSEHALMANARYFLSVILHTGTLHF